jgi:hypothetical protein
MNALAFKLGVFVGELIVDLFATLIVYWPLNFLLVLFVVWLGIPAHAGWPDPTLTQAAYISLAISVLGGRRRAP